MFAALLKILIEAIFGEVVELAKREDTIEDAEPVLDSLEVVDNDDGLGHFDIFDGLLDSDKSALRPGDEAT